MKLLATRLPGVLIVEPAVFADDRGWFMESFNQARWEAGLRELGEPASRPFVQDAQGKLVRVVQGAAFDVAVDLRRESPTFGQWEGVELSALNKRQLWIPEGFAHGFLALQDDTHFLYKTTDVYARDCERSIRWDDPAIGIGWPLPPGLKAPLVAPKYSAAPALDAPDLS